MINVNTVNSQAITLLRRLNEPGNEALLSLIELQISEAKQKLVKADNDMIIYRLQGRAEAFEDFLKAIEDAKKVLI